MIMAALDNVLNNRAMQQHFAKDPVSWAARTYLGIENLGLGSARSPPAYQAAIQGRVVSGINA